MDLVCPEGLLAKGLSWYSVPNSQNFSICVNCKPEKEGPYQWIEICYANNENTLGGLFVFKTQSCEEKSFYDSNLLIKKMCQAENSVCGLTLTTEMPTLEFALKTVQSLPCANAMTDTAIMTEIKPNIVGYDVDLACPEKSTLSGFQRYNLPASRGSIPIISAVCKLNHNIVEQWITVGAKAKLNVSGAIFWKAHPSFAL